MRMRIYAAFVAAALSAPAVAAPIDYRFTSGPIRSATGVAANLLPDSTSVSGSFTYDSSAPFILNGLGGATSFYEGAITDFVLNIGDLTVSDPFGYVLVANDLFNVPNPTGGFSPRLWDLLEFYVGPTGPGGWTGLEIGGQTVGRIRYYIEEGPFGTPTPDFLSDESLPLRLPNFSGGLSLDFSPLTGGTSYLGTAGVMMFGNLTFSAVAVQEPSILSLGLLGAVALFFAMQRRTIRQFQ